MYLASRIHRLQLYRLPNCHKLLIGEINSQVLRAFSSNGLSENTVNKHRPILLQLEAERKFLSPTPSIQTSLRHHYQDPDFHPSTIVRAYRKTRTWLADNFLREIYSISIIVTFMFLGIVFTYIAWIGPASGLDDNKILTKQKLQISYAFVFCLDLGTLFVSLGKSGSIADNAERFKHNHYTLLKENYIFTPIAFESLGSMGPENKKFIKKLGS